jgi:SAM-dependent methyltransferase
LQYDPIKKIIGSVVGASVVRRKLFYKLLGLMFLREWHVKRALRSILRTASQPLRILDAGAGFGQYTYYCAKRSPSASILAVDVKAEQVEDCTRFFKKAKLENVRFAVEDLTQMEHEEEFDLAISVDVMEHIADDVTVFRNLHRSLKRGGTLLVNTPSDLGGSDAHSPEDESFIGEHARAGYGVEEIRGKLRSAGLITERIAFTYGPYGSAAWRLGIKYPMVMLNASRLFFLLLPFYFLITLPFTLLLMYLDFAMTNKTGTGLLVIAKKGS